MSPVTPITDLDRIRAQRKYEPMLPQNQQQTQSAPPPTSTPSGSVGGAVGALGGNYVANTMLNSGTAGASSVGAGGSGIGSGTLTIGGKVPAVGAQGGTATVGGNTGLTSATTAGPSPFSLSGIGSAGNVILPAVGAYGAYDLIKRQGDMPGNNRKAYLRGIGQGAASGAAMGSYFGPVGALVGGGIGGIAGGIGAFTGSGKDEDQMGRDAIRKAMLQQGGVDQDFNVTLADGSKFNIGLDGGGKIMTKSGNEINPYNIDTDNPFAHQATLWAMPLASILTGGNQKLGSDFTGYFTNAAMSNANTLEGVRANVLNIMAANKIDFPTARQALSSQLAAGAIDQFRHDVYQQALSVLESGDSKQYDTRTVQQFLQDQAAKQQPAPSAVPNAIPVPQSQVSAQNPAFRPTATPPPQPTPPPTPAQSQGGNIFQRLIEEAKRREQGAMK